MHLDLKEIDVVKGKIKCFALIKNKHCLFEDFLEILKSEGGYESEIKRIYAILDMYVKEPDKPLPDNIFKAITPKNEREKEYEIKTKSLRVYLIHQNGVGKIIIMMGKKTTQKSDIKTFRNLKQEYLNSLKI